MLKRADPIKCLSSFGTQYEIPKNSTDTISMRRCLPLDADATTQAPKVTASDYLLSEGATPAARTLTYVDVTAQLQEYGVLYKLSSKTYRMYEDRAIDDMVTNVSDHIATLEEMICYGALRAGTNVIVQNGTVRTDVTQSISLGRIRQAARSLAVAHGKTVTKRLSTGADFATAPVSPAYLVFVHTDLIADCRNIPGFTPIANYGSYSPVHEREFGAVEDFRFIASPYFRPFLSGGGSVSSGTMLVNGVSGSGNADVYPCLIVAADAWGQVALKGMRAVSPIVITPDTTNHANPLRRFGYVGAEFVKTVVRTNENWMVRLECAASVLS
jgi:N4-gp56 family major capsid protein